MTTKVLQRLRVVFSKGAEIRYISHLDVARAWQRAFRRASVPLAYSSGFNPRPKVIFAAAIAVGFAGRAEMLDVLLMRRMPPREFASRVQEEMPSGLHLSSVEEVSIGLPPLPTQVLAAEYEVVVETVDAAEVMQARLDEVLVAETISRRRERPGKVQIYDLRPLIKKLWVADRREDGCVIGMYLQADAQGTGRPDEVMAAMGLTEMVRSIERVQLLFESG